MKYAVVLGVLLLVAGAACGAEPVPVADGYRAVTQMCGEADVGTFDSCVARLAEEYAASPAAMLGVLAGAWEVGRDRWHEPGNGTAATHDSAATYFTRMREAMERQGMSDLALSRAVAPQAPIGFLAKMQEWQFEAGSIPATAEPARTDGDDAAGDDPPSGEDDYWSNTNDYWNNMGVKANYRRQP